ncbi:MAG: HD domain-containing protein [Candidatus Thorarchaeota archaeon]
MIQMIAGLEEKMRDRVLRESSATAIEEWTDFLNRLDEPFFNYRGTHVVEVVRVAKYLARENGADYDVVVMAAWFHDVSKSSTTGGGAVHGKDSANIAREYLLKEGVDSEIVEKVCDAIEKHVGLTLDEPLSPLEAQIVWESDKLVKIGIIGMLFNLINGLRYEPNSNMEGFLERTEEVLPLLRKIAASMNTEVAKRMANDRIHNYELFIKLLESEINLGV